MANILQLNGSDVSNPQRNGVEINTLQLNGVTFWQRVTGPPQVILSGTVTLRVEFGDQAIVEFGNQNITFYEDGGTQSRAWVSASVSTGLFERRINNGLWTGLSSIYLWPGIHLLEIREVADTSNSGNMAIIVEENL
ncbi:hypothetical protein [Paraferrimonas haliotis]|uniref:Uncharacterized protein n=1 Tax=Paraferrimonas haliotis TaxID=2013866 RepID=A0AA37TV56_9GAMM|nr:hypothetical protein [Paraferrimonas haliotis]GLS83215.1 hypothetical protein GCM10007894_11920 [Paraferrimonas haliotis]